MMLEKISERWFVSGRVQKVGFRYYTMRRAVHHSIHGGARNLPDGRVEIIAIGAQEQLEAFFNDIQKGPPFAKVQTIDRKTITGEHPVWNEFDILFTED